MKRFVLAQLVEQVTVNHRVVGSSPTDGAKIQWPYDEVVSYRIVYPRLRVRFSLGSPFNGLWVDVLLGQ